MASHVAEFETPQPQPPPHHAYPPHPMHMMQQHPIYPPLNPYAPPPHPGQPHVKAEPIDGRFALNAPQGYALPVLPGPPPGPQLAGSKLPNPGGQQSILSFPAGPPPTAGRGQPAPYTSTGGVNMPQQPRIPQVDGPSSSSASDSPSPPPSQSYAPHPSHPSLPQPSQASGSLIQPDESEAINSDLDDSDTGDEEEADEGGAGDSDIVFCTYDKVARVKNKWKCILKDGMIHVNGKDYLFAKCTGEFEW